MKRLKSGFIIFAVIISMTILATCFFSCERNDMYKIANEKEADGIGGTTYSAGDNETMTAGSVNFNIVYVPGGITYMAGINDDGDKNNDGDTIDPEDEPGGTTVDNAYWITETEVTYELWYAVHNWALSNGYTFANPGREGHDGTITDPAGALPTAAKLEPVTTINWRDAMVWMNALTEYYNVQNGTSLVCVYYTDAVYTTPIRDSSDGIYGASVNPNAGGFDDPYVKPDADGFRLLSSDEWELAARYIADSNSDGDIEDSGEYYPGNHVSGDTTSYCHPSDGGTSTVFGNYCWYTGNSGASTHEVSQKIANALGLYDMSGNVWEWVFDLSGSFRVGRGGGWSYTADIMRVGYWGYDDPYDVYDSMGFRFARTP